MRTESLLAVILGILVGAAAVYLLFYNYQQCEYENELWLTPVDTGYTVEPQKCQGVVK